MAIVGTVEYTAKIDTKQMKADATAAENIAKETGTAIGTEVEKGSQKASKSLGGLFAAAAGGAALTSKLFSEMADSINTSFKLQSSLAGLSSVSKTFGQDVGLANQAAQDLASDGLMTVTDSALGLKNLMSSGFSLPESIKLMKALKDQAVYNRQSYYDLGGAVTATTEGIKNGNSVLADATGTTKNLSVMAKEAGIGIDEMGSISNNAGYRLAVFNGFMGDAARSSGDAAKYIDTAAGKTAQMSAQSTILEQEIGTALQPALLELLKVVTPIITNIANWVEKNPELAATIIIATTAVTGLITAFGLVGLSILGLSPLFKGLVALITAPITMPALIVGAAVFAIMEVFNAANKALGALDDLKTSMDNSSKVTENIRLAAQSAKASGDIEKYNKLQKIYIDSFTRNTEIAKESSNINLWTGFQQGLQSIFGSSNKKSGGGGGGFASGGFTGNGDANEIAGVVHKGEFVVPKIMVNQSTGTPMMGGSNITQYNTINTEIDMDVVTRNLTWQLRRT